MPEFFEMDPQDLVEDVVEEYSVRSDQVNKGRVAGFALIGGIMAFVQFAEPYARGAPADSGRGIGGIVFAALVLIGGIVGWRWWKFGTLSVAATGSRIVLSDRAIYWWRGKLPRVERRIGVDDIGSVVFVPGKGEDAEAMVLKDRAGAAIEFPEACVQHARSWAWALTKHFPHIAYDWTDQYPSLRSRQ